MKCFHIMAFISFYCFVNLVCLKQIVSVKMVSCSQDREILFLRTSGIYICMYIYIYIYWSRWEYHCFFTKFVMNSIWSMFVVKIRHGLAGNIRQMLIHQYNLVITFFDGLSCSCTLKDKCLIQFWDILSQSVTSGRSHVYIIHTH
jgi:hypothetical protein